MHAIVIGSPLYLIWSRTLRRNTNFIWSTKGKAPTKGGNKAPLTKQEKALVRRVCWPGPQDVNTAFSYCCATRRLHQGEISGQAKLNQGASAADCHFPQVPFPVSCSSPCRSYCTLPGPQAFSPLYFHFSLTVLGISQCKIQIENQFNIKHQIRITVKIKKKGCEKRPIISNNVV